MHNTDRILNEDEYEYGFLNESDMEYGNPYGYESGFAGEWEWEGDFEEEWESSSAVFSPEMEYELAAELLAVNNEYELDQFLGRLVKRAARGVSNFARSPVGRSLIGGLKAVAKTALPIAGKAAGTFFGGPLGGAIGGKLGSMAANLFEMNLEGMSNEDREFEVARRVVRLSGAATQNAVRQIRNGQARGVPPPRLAMNALKGAASKHAPGLLTPARPRPPRPGFHGVVSGFGGNAWAYPPPPPSPPPPTSGSFSGGGSAYSSPPPAEATSGTWVRQGDQIILTV